MSSWARAVVVEIELSTSRNRDLPKGIVLTIVPGPYCCNNHTDIWTNLLITTEWRKRCTVNEVQQVSLRPEGKSIHVIQEQRAALASTVFRSVLSFPVYEPFFATKYFSIKKIIWNIFNSFERFVCAVA